MTAGPIRPCAKSDPVRSKTCIITCLINHSRFRPASMSLNHQDVNTEEQATVLAAAVREQLTRLVESPPFNHSRRFPTFLRFVIEHALAGNADQLKERTIGIEVFGREAEYDTASDPIVRVTAAEIRKRIAQYYQEPGHETELRVTLPAGSYVPQFHWPQAAK